tara:strand:+ start:1156 stop:2649 length:1494 start_codon:yes stop_codon:yes gene_type:complete
MRTLLKVCLLLFFFAPLSAYAGKAAVKVEYVDQSRFKKERLFRIYIDVKDSEGGVPELDAEDIQVIIDQDTVEEGDDAKSSINIRKASDFDDYLGMDVILVLPTTEIIKTEPKLMAEIQRGAKDFIETLHESDRSAIWTFDGCGVKERKDLNTKHESALKAISRLPTYECDVTSGEPRLLRDYLTKILEKGFTAIEDEPNRRTALLLLTDGRDDTAQKEENREKAESQRDAITECARRVRRCNKEIEDTATRFYVIGLEGLGNELTGVFDLLRATSEDTGGSIIEVPAARVNPDEVRSQFENMADRILGQQVVEWKPRKVRRDSELQIRLSNLKLTSTPPYTPEDGFKTRSKSAWSAVFTFFKWVFIIGIIVLVIMLIVRALRNRGNKEEYIEAPAYDAGARAMLTVIGGPDMGMEVPIVDEVTSFGRSDACDIQFSDAAMSRRHAAIRMDKMRFELSDIQSSSGTFVNGRRVEKCFLQDGDKIMLAKTEMSFRLVR